MRHSNSGTGMADVSIGAMNELKELVSRVEEKLAHLSHDFNKTAADQFADAQGSQQLIVERMDGLMNVFGSMQRMQSDMGASVDALVKFSCASPGTGKGIHTSSSSSSLSSSASTLASSVMPSNAAMESKLNAILSIVSELRNTTVSNANTHAILPGPTPPLANRRQNPQPALPPQQEDVDAQQQRHTILSQQVDVLEHKRYALESEVETLYEQRNLLREQITGLEHIYEGYLAFVSALQSQSQPHDQDEKGTQPASFFGVSDGQAHANLYPFNSFIPGVQHAATYCNGNENGDDQEDAEEEQQRTPLMKSSDLGLAAALSPGGLFESISPFVPASTVTAATIAMADQRLRHHIEATMRDGYQDEEGNGGASGTGSGTGVGSRIFGMWRGKAAE
ncbi:hypothetical protein HK102_007511 [Quaeritorhiza haematococci]|nr:hypothetical protein HK102_007511 [Quaeritorhiza haematococci]